MSRFGISQAKLNGSFHSGVRGYQVDRGLDVESEGSDGIIYQSAHNLIARKPMADLTTYDLKGWIAALDDSSDLPMKALDGTNGLILYGQKAASGLPGFASGSVHLTRTGLAGIIFGQGIRWSRGQKADLALRAMFKSADGVTEAISEGTAALPTQPVPDFGFALYSAQVGGDSITTINSLDLAIESRFEFEYSTGLPDPTDIIGAGTNGKLAVTLRADVGDLDLGDGTGSTVLVFKRYASGGGFGSDTVTLTLHGVWSTEENVGGDNGSPMKRDLLVRTAWNGTTKPLTWTVA